MEETAYNIPLVEVDQPIQDPIREVVPIGPNKLNALTHFPEIRRSARITQEPDRYEGGMIKVAVETDHEDPPGTYKEATNQQEKAKLWKAMEGEVRTIKRKDVWILTHLTPGR